MRHNAAYGLCAGLYRSGAEVTCEAARAAGRKAAERVDAKPEQMTAFTAGVSMEGCLAEKL